MAARTKKKAATKAPAKKKATTKKAPEPPKVEVTKGDADLLDRISAKGLEIETLRTREEKSKATHKKDKDALDEAHSALFQMVRARNTTGPLIDRMEEDGWKKVPLLDALGPKLLKAIVDGKPLKDLANNLTVGGLAAFTKDHKLTDLVGLGATTATKIEDALLDWWSRNPQWCKPTKAKARKKASAPPSMPKGPQGVLR